jgi:hypothetical protein
VNGTNPYRAKQRGASVACLVLFGVSLVVAMPVLFSTSSLLHSSAATSAGKLSISVAPAVLDANPSFNALMSVQLLSTSNSFPVPVTTPIEVVLTSNNTNVAAPSATLLYITSGSYATENLTAGGSAGYANITASAPGYLPAWFIVTARNPIASGPNLKNFIVPYFAPSEISSNNQNYPNMIFGALETLNVTSGLYYPKAATSPVQVWGRSSNNATMSVSTAPYTIPTGGFYALFNLTSTYFPGVANVTLQANNWNTLTTSFTSYGNGLPLPKPPVPYFSVINTITPSRVLPGETFNIQVFAETVNAPISSAGANLTWSAKGASISSFDSNLNSTGYGTATLVASKQSGVDNVTVSIKEGGITPFVDNITVNAYLNNLNVTVINGHPSIVTDYTTTFMLHALFNNTGVANATISWIAKNGTLISPPAKTNGTGYAVVNFESGSRPGTYIVEANVTKFGFSNVTEAVSFSVVQRVTSVQTPQGPSNFFYTKVGNVLPLWALIPIVGGAAGGGFFYFKKFRNRESFDEEEDEE